MAFPDDPQLPVMVEIAPGADLDGDPWAWSWEDITGYTRETDKIRIIVGKADEAKRLSPSRCKLKLDNTDGHFSPRNPLGQWYGQIGPNTPLRVRSRHAYDAFDRTVASGWGTATSGQVWATSGGSSSDFSVASGIASQSLGSANVLRNSLLDVGSATQRMTVDVTVPVVPTGAAITVWAVVRTTDTNNYYAAVLNVGVSGVMALSLFRRSGGTLAPALAVSTDLAAHAAGQTWRIVVEAAGSRLRATAWRPDVDVFPGWLVRATDVGLTAGTLMGVLSRRETGNTNGTVVVDFDDFDVSWDRFCGHVSSWPPRWDKSLVDATVPIEALGSLRIPRRGNPGARSPVYRTTLASSPVAYWSLEDGAAAGVAGSALPGHDPMSILGSVEMTPVSDVTIGSRTLRYGVSSLIDLAGGGQLTGPVPTTATDATASGWTVELKAGRDVTTASGDIVLLDVHTPGGTYVRWRYQYVKSTLRTQVIAFDGDGATTTVVDLAGANTGFGPVSLSVRQNGGNIDVGIDWSHIVGIWAASGSIAGTLAGVQRIVVNATGVTQSTPFEVGHLALWPGYPTPIVAQYTDAYGVVHVGSGLSWQNEAATERLTRLCAEDGLALDMPSVDARWVHRMGWQPVAAAQTLYQECEAVDNGVLIEDGFGLGYLPREHRYNPPVMLTLDGAADQVADAPEPVDDDQQLRNRVTVSRSFGSSATAEDADSIAAVGLYEDDSLTVNLADDDGLASRARWEVHTGTVAEMRWPVISVDLAGAPELIDQVLACRPQSRIVMDNPPPQALGAAVDVLVEGYTETIGYRVWRVDFNCSPAAPWRVFVVGDPVYGRLATKGSALAIDAAASDTTLLVATTSPYQRWITTAERAGDFPMMVSVAGILAQVTGIDGTTSPQVFHLAAPLGWDLPAGRGVQIGSQGVPA